MYKKRMIPVLAVALLVFCLGTVVLHTMAVSASAVPSNRPIFTIRIDKQVISVGERFDTWLYVTNPSTNMETGGTPRAPIHIVEVNYLRVIIVRPDGSIDEVTFHPDDPTLPGLAYRWDPVVYPLETSLVFFVGWSVAEPGVYKFTYTLNVTFEGETFDLVRTFNILVKDT